MSSTPLIVTTDVGDQVAALATPYGPYVELATFQVGDAYGYTPQKTDTGLNGNVLYTSKPFSYQNAGDQTLNLILKLPPDVGPFNFGEIGIFLADGRMFAKLVFETLQVKDGLDSASNAVTAYTMDCLLNVGKSVSVFRVDTESGLAPPIWEVDLWSDIYPPNQSANPTIPTILVRELTINNNSSYVTKASDSKWTLGTTYQKLALGQIVSATTTTVDIAKQTFTDLKIDLDQISPANNRQFVVEFEAGYFRSVASVTDLGTNLRFNLNPDALPILPNAGSNFVLHVDKFYVRAGFSPPLSPEDMQNIVYTFSTGGTFSLPVPALPEGWDSMQMQLSIQGGGAGGGGAAGSGAPNSNPSASGGGGGAGSYVTYDVPAPASGTVLQVVVGGGGGGGGATTQSATRAGSGGVGGQSRVTVPAGASYTASGGVGGTGALNPHKASIQSAPGGAIGGGNGTATFGATTFGGAGGRSRYGLGGGTSSGNAVGLGAGGGGGWCQYINSDNVSPHNGGSGKNGIITVTFYNPNVAVLNTRYKNLVDWLDSTPYGPVPPDAR